MQPGVTTGAVLELHAARANAGIAPGYNGPLLTQWWDTSGNANHGTLTNFNGTPTSGWAGHGTTASPHQLVFDAADDFVAPPALHAADNKVYTYEAWVVWPAVSTWREIISESATVDDTHRAEIRVQNDGKLLALYWDGVTLVSAASAAALTPGQIYHVACTADATTLRLYVDGAEVNNASIAARATITTATTTIGALRNTGTSFRWFGPILAARIYDSALTPTQVAANYAAGYLWPLPITNIRTSHGGNASAVTDLAHTHGLTLNRGDFLFAQLQGNAAGLTFTDNNGDTPWQKQVTAQSGESSTHDLWFRIVEDPADEPATWHWTISSATSYGIDVQAQAGVDQLDPFDVDPADTTQTGSVAGSAITVNSITVPHAGSLGVVAVGCDSSTTPFFSLSTPNGYGSEVENTVGRRVALYRREILPQGATGTVVVATADNLDGYVAWHFALRAAVVERLTVDIDDTLFQIVAGSDALGWKDISADVSNLVYSSVRPGGTGSITFAVPIDVWNVGDNQLAPDQEVIVRYAGIGVARGFILPRPISYTSADGTDSKLVTIEAEGVLGRAKRRQDYCHVWRDVDLSQWSEDQNGGLSPGILVTTSGVMRFAAANGSTFADGALQRWVYWIHGGLAEQDIDHVTFSWQSNGTMTWWLYEGTTPVHADWAQLATGGGSSTLLTEVSANVTAGQYAIALACGYATGKTLTEDEWVEFLGLAVHGQAGDVTVYDAIADCLVVSGLASSSVTV